MQQWARAVGILLLSWPLAPDSLSADDAVVARDFTDNSAAGWTLGAWGSAVGRISTVEDGPKSPGPCLEIAVDYSGKGFEHFAINPVSKKIPGHCKRLAIWAKASAPGYFWLVTFKDAQGREAVGGKKLEWAVKTDPGQWTRSEFTVPTDWAQPISIEAIATHNWDAQQKKATAVLRVCDLRVETDISAVADRGPLVRVEASTGVERNLFAGGEPVRYRVSLDSWLGRELTGTLTYRIMAPDGNVAARREKRVTLRDMHAETIDFQPPRFGVYEIAVEVKLDTGAAFQKTSRFASIPRPSSVTRAEKMRSPYGLNIHGGSPGVGYEAIAKLGFTWIRDYAYSREWMDRARGEDGRYAGWPWYPQIDKRVQQSGLMLLPCMITSIGSQVKAGRLAPNKQWKLDLLHILMAFPQYPAWELDNEYDYHHAKDETARNWSSYHAFHELFAAAVKFVDDQVLTVEQGTAGVHPDWVRRSIAQGAFDKIDVVNGHFYCGRQPPELSTANENVGNEDLPPALLWDTLRDFVAAADCDGKNRQAWITEFGWDTLAGHVVSPQEQAAYLQRGYLLQLQAGIDKMFWYWERDTKETPKQFFDGCGLFDPRDEPKPAAAAMAGLTHFLKLPQPVGSFDLGPNTLGYVFRDRARLVACAFQIQRDGPAAEVDFPQGELFDLFANPLPARQQRLGIAPLWIVGLPESDPIYLQTAYELASRQVVRVTAGDSYPIELRVRNNRASALRSRLEVRWPSGWSAEGGDAEVAVPAGAEKTFPIRVRIAPGEKAGTQDVAVTVVEGALRKHLKTSFLVVPAAEVTVEPLSGEPGEAALTATVKNNSQQARRFLLKTQVPGTWKIEPREIALDVAATAAQSAPFRLNWSNDWKDDESAQISVWTTAGEPVAQAGVIPNALRVPRVEKIVADGDLGEWPSQARLPRWATGSVGAAAVDAEVFLWYSDQGLHFACRVSRSKAEVLDPKSFWLYDCLEVFLDTQNDKRQRNAYLPTDHQFWFSPLAAEQRVYVGRWKRCQEIPETLYDIPGIKSFCKKTPDGYVMEVTLPAAALRGFDPRAGRKLGVNVNLTILRDDARREVYWPRRKDQNLPQQPHRWGVVELR